MRPSVPLASDERTNIRRPQKFDYRGVKPAILGTTLTLNAALDADSGEVWVALDDDAGAMQARVTFS